MLLCGNSSAIPARWTTDCATGIHAGSRVLQPETNQVWTQIFVLFLQVSERLLEQIQDAAGQGCNPPRLL